MASFLTTMSVQPPAALQSSPPQPLPHCTLRQSASCATINTYATLRSPEPAYYSPTSAAAQKLHGFNSPGSPFSNARTRGQFKPQRTNKGNSSYQLRQFAEATLGSGSLKKAVKLPEGEDLNEWLAVNSTYNTLPRIPPLTQPVVDFYNQINLLYGSITEFCSPQTCPEMKATDEFEYLWQDAATGYPKPTKMPAPTYIEHLMTWVQSNIDNLIICSPKICIRRKISFPALSTSESPRK